MSMTHFAPPISDGSNMKLFWHYSVVVIKSKAYRLDDISAVTNIDG